MSNIQALQRAMKLTHERQELYVVIEERFENHKPSYHIMAEASWLKIQRQHPSQDRYRKVWPEVGA